MATLTFSQKALIVDSMEFQKRLQIALQERAMYWLNPANTTFAGKIAGVKYRTLADGIFNNRIETTKQRNDRQAVLVFLASFKDPNPPLDGSGLPADSVLVGASADSQFYFDAYFKDWAGVTTADETANYVAP